MATKFISILVSLTTGSPKGQLIGLINTINITVAITRRRQSQAETYESIGKNEAPHGCP